MNQSLEIALFPCLSDNYGFLIHDPESGETAAIDTPEASKIEVACAELPGLTRGVSGGDSFRFGQHEVQVIFTPGHTVDHIIYYVPSAKSVWAAGDYLKVRPKICLAPWQQSQRCPMTLKFTARMNIRSLMQNLL